MPLSPNQDPRLEVRISERLFTDEVGIAGADDVIQPRDPSYEFNNRKFDERVIAPGQPKDE